MHITYKIPLEIIAFSLCSEFSITIYLNEQKYELQTQKSTCNLILSARQSLPLKKKKNQHLKPSLRLLLLNTVHLHSFRQATQACKAEKDVFC